MTELPDGIHPPFSLAAVDDHQVVLNGILWTLGQHAPWIEVVGAFQTVDDLLAGRHADVVLLDLDLRGSDGDEAENVRRIVEWGARVLIFTALDDKPARIRRAIRAGALGVALKSDAESELIVAISTARAGALAASSRLAHALITDDSLLAHLAPREIEVFRLMAQGVGRNDIGRLMDPPVSSHTVTEYIQRVGRRYHELGRPSFNAYETMRHVVKDGYVDLGH